MSTRNASVGLHERRHLAALVEGVAAGEVGGHRLVVEVGDLLGAPLGPHLGIGGEVHLELGVGEHDRADVAALEHAAAVGRRPLALAPHHLGAHGRVGGHDADRPADLGAADLDGGVDAVDGHAVARATSSSMSPDDPRHLRRPRTGRPRAAGPRR